MLRQLFSLTLALLCAFTSSEKCKKFEDYQIDIPGDIMLGGVLTVRTSTAAYTATCSDSISDYMVVRAEAYVFAIDKANELLSPANISIGLWALDSCENDVIGVQNGLKLLQPTGNRTKFHAILSTASTDVVGALSVVGSSCETCVPIVSASASGEVLTQLTCVSHVPPLVSRQANAIAELLFHLRLTNVAIFNVESNYGNSFVRELTNAIEKLNKVHDLPLCVRGVVPIMRDWHVDKDYLSWLLDEGEHANATSLVVLADNTVVQSFLQHLHQVAPNRQWQFVGSAGWIGRFNPLPPLPASMLLNAVGMAPVADENAEFESYFRALTIYGARRNLWTVAAIQREKKCCFLHCSNDLPKCKGDERINVTQSHLDAIRGASYVINSTLDVAAAILSLHERLCEAKPGLCDALKNMDGHELFAAISNATSRRLAEYEPNLFSVRQYRPANNGAFTWQKIGEYSAFGSLTLERNASISRDFLNALENDRNLCFPTLPCQQRGTYPIFRSDRCCWKCGICSRTQQARAPFQNISDGRHVLYRCVDCNNLKFRDELSECEPQFIDYESPSAILLMVLSIIFILFSISVDIYLWKHGPTAILVLLFGGQKRGTHFVSSGLHTFLIFSTTQFMLPMILFIPPNWPALCTALPFLWTFLAVGSVSVLCAAVLKIELTSNFDLLVKRKTRSRSTDSSSSTASGASSFDEILLQNDLIFKLIIAVGHIANILVFVIWICLALVPTKVVVQPAESDGRVHQICWTVIDPSTDVTRVPYWIILLVTLFYGFRGTQTRVIVLVRFAQRCTLATSLFFIACVLRAIFQYGLNTTVNQNVQLMALMALLQAVAHLVLIKLPLVWFVWREPEKNNKASLATLRNDLTMTSQTTGGRRRVVYEIRELPIANNLQQEGDEARRASSSFSSRIAAVE